MPIKPIDLQTLFLQMNQVGREQNAVKEGAALQQSIAQGQLQRKAAEMDSAVSKTEEPDTGAEGIKDREGSQNKGGKSGERKPKEEEHAEEPETEIVKDPDLGTHIDISG